MIRHRGRPWADSIPEWHLIFHCGLAKLLHKLQNPTSQTSSSCCIVHGYITYFLPKIHTEDATFTCSSLELTKICMSITMKLIPWSNSANTRCFDYSPFLLVSLLSSTTWTPCEGPWGPDSLIGHGTLVSAHLLIVKLLSILASVNWFPWWQISYQCTVAGRSQKGATPLYCVHPDSLLQT